MIKRPPVRATPRPALPSRAWPRLAVALICIVVGGCTTPVAAPISPPAPLIVDNYCETVRKRSWSTHDTPETIREAVAHNRAVDRRCLPPAS
jgi:hypothetical protein